MDSLINLGPGQYRCPWNDRGQCALENNWHCYDARAAHKCPFDLPKSATVFWREH